MILKNEPQAPYVNSGSFKCIPDMNLSPANKKLSTNSLFYAFKTKYHLKLVLYLKDF